MLPTFDPATIFAGMLAMIRAGAFLMGIPFIGSQRVPARARVAMAGLLALLVTGTTAPDLVAPANWAQAVGLGTQEFLTGALMGLGVRLFVGVLEMAGHMISMEIGLMMSQALNPSEAGQQTTVGIILFYFGTLIFFAAGFHHDVLLAFVQSYQVCPIGHNWLSFESADTLMNASAQLFYTGLQIAAPFLAVSFLINMSFAVLGKVSPNVNVFVISFAIKIAVGFGLFLFVGQTITRLVLDTGEALPSLILKLVAP